MRVLIVIAVLGLAACDGAGATVRTTEGPIDELRLTTTPGELTIGGEASIGVSGEL